MTARSPRTSPWITRLLLLVLIVLGTTAVTAQPAAADICQDAPAPVAPKSGLPGMLTTVPKDIPDSAPDPFTDPSVPIGSVYGYNWGWANYDLGCGSDFLRDPVAVTNTKSANVVMSVLGGTLAGLASLEQMAKTSSIDWLARVVNTVADQLRGPLLGLWLPLAMLAVGLIIGFRSKRASYADTFRTALIVLGAIVMAAFALVYPLVASSAVDKGVVTVSEAVGQQFSASASDAVTRESAYRTWLTGNFGDPDSAIAAELGPRLLGATHYTWSDMKRMQADPNAKKSIDAAKSREFKAVAKELEDRDPAAYEVFTGRGERTGPALFGLVVVLAMGLFVALSMLMVLIARVMMQGLALAAPLAAVLGVLPTHTSVLARLWDLFTASLIAVAKFVVAGGVMALVLGAIQTTAGIGAGAKLFWVVVATVVGIVLTRPARTFKTIVPGLDPGKSYLRPAVSGVASYVGSRLGSQEGVEAGVRDSAAAAPPAAAEEPAAESATAASARESLDPLPRPAWESPGVPSPVPAAVPVVGSGSSPRHVLTGSAAPTWSRTEAWPGLAGPADRPALAPAETTPVAPRHAAPARPVPVAAAPVAALDTGSDVVVDAPTTGAPVAPVDPSRFDRPRTPVPVQAGSEVVFPTGIIVAAEEQPFYQRSASQRPEDLYIPMADLELAPDGTEHELVTYHRRRVGASRG